jgi:hypothetical protein
VATRCIVVDCPSVTESPIQPEPGWALFKLSALMRGALVTVDSGSICPACLADFPALRSPLQQIVPPPAPAPELETAATADAPTPAPEPLEAAAAAPETVEITAADVGAVPADLKAE